MEYIRLGTRSGFGSPQKDKIFAGTFEELAKAMKIQINFFLRQIDEDDEELKKLLVKISEIEKAKDEKQLLKIIRENHILINEQDILFEIKIDEEGKEIWTESK